MATRPQEVAAGPTHSRQVLEETPARTLKLLTGIARDRAIRALLEGRGFRPAVHQEGWAFLHRVSGYTSTPAPELDAATGAALKELDAWDEPNLGIADATLLRHHPAQHAVVFDALTPASGIESITSTTLFLDRLDTLDGGTRADKAAVATLAERGITAAERERVRGLLATARGDDQAPAPPPAEDSTDDLLALKAWFDEWSTIAKKVIKKRSQLIRLGLAQRIARKPKATPAA